MVHDTDTNDLTWPLQISPQFSAAYLSVMMSLLCPNIRRLALHRCARRPLEVRQQGVLTIRLLSADSGNDSDQNGRNSHLSKFHVNGPTTSNSEKVSSTSLSLLFLWTEFSNSSRWFSFKVAPWGSWPCDKEGPRLFSLFLIFVLVTFP